MYFHWEICKKNKLNWNWRAKIIESRSTQPTALLSTVSDSRYAFPSYIMTNCEAMQTIDIMDEISWTSLRVELHDLWSIWFCHT